MTVGSSAFTFTKQWFGTKIIRRQNVRTPRDQSPPQALTHHSRQIQDNFIFHQCLLKTTNVRPNILGKCHTTIIAMQSLEIVFTSQTIKATTANCQS